MAPRKRSIPDVVVIDAAIRALQTRGASQLRIADVAAEAGLAAATLIQRFGTREALLDLIGQKFIDDLRTEFRSGPPDLAQISEHLMFFLAHPSHDYVTAFRTQLGMWLAAQVEEGAFPPHDVARMSREMQIHLFGLAITHAPPLHRSTAPSHNLARVVPDMFAAFETGGTNEQS